MYELGAGLYSEKQFEKALFYFNNSIQRNNKNKDAYYNRGLTKWQLGNKEGACNDWKKAFELGDYESGKIFSENCQ